MALTPAHVPLGSVVDGGKMTTLGLDDLQLLRLGLRVLATSMASRDGAVPANVLVLQGLLDRVVAGAVVAGRLPTAAVLGSDGSPYAAPAGTVGGMDIREAAKMLGCGHRNVRDLVTRGQLAGRKSRGRWLIAPLDLQDLLDARRSA